MFAKTSSSFKENIRGQSVGHKNPFQGLRSIEPKFFNNIGNNMGKKEATRMDKQILVVRKQNIEPVLINANEHTNKKSSLEELAMFKKTEPKTFNPVQQHKKRKQQQRAESAQLKKKRFCCYPRGFHNIGNTCYMNSTLQCLFHQPLFNYALLAELQKRLGSAAEEFGSVIKELGEKKSGGALNLRDLKKAIGRRKPIFLGNAQHDAQEFLTSVLEILNTELTRIKWKAEYRELEGDPCKKSLKSLSQEWWSYYLERDNSMVCDLFQGQMISTVTCYKCKHKSVSFDNFWGIPISLQKGSSIRQMLSCSWGVDQSVDCYFCTGCKKTRTCGKKIELFKIPSILVIQIKRFDFSRGSRRKRNDEICIDCELDLSGALCSESEEPRDCGYSLKGVVHHYGEAQFGHYNAQVLNESDQRWYCMDDSHMDQCSKPSHSKSAYLFFYQKTGC